MNARRISLLIAAGLLLVIFAQFLVPVLREEAALIFFKMNSGYGITPQTFPRIDGSTSMQPVLGLLACRTAGVRCHWITEWDGQTFLRPESGKNVPRTSLSGTHKAYQKLIQNETDLILVARRPSPDELDLARQQSVTVETQPIALDAFIFIANTQNPVRSLTPEQVKAIYTGKINRWNELGGNDAPIAAYQRDRNSGSQELMEALVLKGEKPIDAPTMIDNTMIVSFYNVGRNPNGLAYSIYYYEEKMARRPDVKVLAVNGVSPNPTTIRRRGYPFVTEVYAAIRSDLDHESSAYHLYEWLQSSAGQALIEQSGYVRIK